MSTFIPTYVDVRFAYVTGRDRQYRRESRRISTDEQRAAWAAEFDRWAGTIRDPLDETNHADRYDCDGERWEWCDKCCGFRTVEHVMHRLASGWTASWINRLYGPVTFAPPPAYTPNPQDGPDLFDEGTQP